MTENQKLLAEYVENGAENAFRELVARYIDFVYSAAFRLTQGDSQLAEDVAQCVFIDLARKAHTLPKEVMLGGWLHRNTCFVAATVMRGERRRRAREREAAEMNTFLDHSESNLSEIKPVLDEAINKLEAEDRHAILLRFFEQRDLRSVGEILGTSENAARMRVTRALERLQVLLKHRGVSYSTAALGAVLASETISAAPAELAASISGAALAGATIGGGGGLTLLRIVTMTKVKFGIVSAVIIAGVATRMILQYQSQVVLREENRSLKLQVHQLAQLTAENERLSNLVARSRLTLIPRLPAPLMRATPVPVETTPGDLRSTNLVARIIKGDKPPQLTAEQIESYLKENRRSAASLVAAFRATNDPKLLEEALEKFPNDPQVNFAAVFQQGLAPEEQRRRLDALKQAAPDNALANYLSALDYFKSGQADQAVQELSAASNKQRFQDYSTEFIQSAEEAWRGAGYSVAEAKALASSQLLLPHLAELKQLGHDMVDLATAYRQTGDEASAQLALQMGANLGRRYDGSAAEALVSQLVGMAIETMNLKAMDRGSSYGNAGETVQARLDQLDLQRARIKDLDEQFQALQPKLSDQDWISYKDRWRTFGEEAAVRWLADKYGQK